MPQLRASERGPSLFAPSSLGADSWQDIEEFGEIQRDRIKTFLTPPRDPLARHYRTAFRSPVGSRRRLRSRTGGAAGRRRRVLRRRADEHETCQPRDNGEGGHEAMFPVAGGPVGSHPLDRVFHVVDRGGDAPWHNSGVFVGFRGGAGPQPAPDPRRSDLSVPNEARPGLSGPPETKSVWATPPTPRGSDQGITVRAWARDRQRKSD
jgi:hypothetical protein